MGQEKTTFYDFDSPADATEAFNLLTEKVRRLEKTPYGCAKFSIPTGSNVQVWIYDTKIKVTLNMGPGITTPNQVMRSVMSEIEVCLSGLAN